MLWTKSSWLLLRYCLLLLLLSHSSLSYPDYLLTRSNCWTELSTDEVIMNAPVVSVAETDDPNMQIIQEKNLFGVRTTNEKTDKDYQYVIDVIQGECSFVKGGCDGNRRVTGRAKDLVELQINGVCQLQAGWSAGHEKVRLTPVLEIGDDERTTQDDATDESMAEEESGQVVNQEENAAARTERIHHDAILEDPSEHHHQDTDRRKKARFIPTKQHYKENLFLYTIGFEGVGISWRDYWRGAMILLLSPIITIAVCLKLTERSNKKRRDL